jgi:hypothetical protein
MRPLGLVKYSHDEFVRQTFDHGRIIQHSAARLTKAILKTGIIAKTPFRTVFLKLAAPIPANEAGLSPDGKPSAKN